jgi:hypothetical protein
MKKYILLVLLIPCLMSDALSQSDNYRLVRFDFGFSYVAPMSSRLSSGFGFTLEPKFQVTDKHTIGLRTGFYFMTSNSLDYIDAYDFETVPTELSVGGAVNFSVYNEYFLTEGRGRPFVGVGFGFYGGGSASVTSATIVGGGTADVGADAFASMGLSPTAGFHFGVLKLTASYHYIFGGTEVNVDVREAGPSGVSSVSLIQKERNDFIELKLMLGIGGGRKDK